MAVLNSEILFHPSGSDNLGGIINTTEQIESGVLHELFDAVSASESVGGRTEYRCIYVRNSSGTSDLTDPIVYVETPPLAVGSSIEIGVGAAPVNGQEDVIADETTVPLGVSFVSAPDAASGIALTDLVAQAYRSMWIKRIIAPGTTSVAADQFTITVLGETV